MSLQDALRSQLIEIIEWTDDSRETLSYRFPDQDKEIKRGAKLIVRESQAARFAMAFDARSAFAVPSTDLDPRLLQQPGDGPQPRFHDSGCRSVAPPIAIELLRPEPSVDLPFGVCKF
jgi:SPFH domain-Band 7 family